MHVKLQCFYHSSFIKFTIFSSKPIMNELLFTWVWVTMHPVWWCSKSVLSIWSLPLYILGCPTSKLVIIQHWKWQPWYCDDFSCCCKLHLVQNCLRCHHWRLHEQVDALIRRNTCYQWGMGQLLYSIPTQKWRVNNQSFIIAYTPSESEKDAWLSLVM